MVKMFLNLHVLAVVVVSCLVDSPVATSRFIERERTDLESEIGFVFFVKNKHGSHCLSSIRWEEEVCAAR